MKALKTILSALVLVCTLALASTEAQAANNDPIIVTQTVMMLKVPVDAMQNQLTITNEQGEVMIQADNLDAGTLFELDMTNFPGEEGYILKFAYISATDGQLKIRKKEFILQ